MDKTTCSNSRNTTKTDLSLLLECLKFQMKCPDLQKQALLTIHSICEKREDNVDLLRELGGVTFLDNLSKSSVIHSEVKEAALFTLCTLADANVYCKNSLCRKDVFTNIAGLLMKEDIPLTQKRVAVYLLFVLVANNQSGQTLAKSTGCLEILLDLFRTSFPLFPGANFKTVNQSYQLWTCVSSALCGCVNNPQNDEGQLICVAAFPTIKKWLQQISLNCIEVLQPMCSFIAMTVANNSCVQESFSVSGGLETLALTLVCVAPAANTNSLSCQMLIIIVKTLSACITDNSALASGLTQYSLVSHLFSVLTSSHLDPDDRLSVLLCIGQFTESSEEHQSQLVQCGGLPVVITFLTEDVSEEVRRAAAFILQTCKQATLCFGVTEKQTEGEQLQIHAEGFRAAAKEMLRRIEGLEKNQLKEAEDEQEDINISNSSEGQRPPSLSPFLLLPPQRREGIKANQKDDSNSNTERVMSMTEKTNTSAIRRLSSSFFPLEKKAGTSGSDVMCSVDEGKGALMSSHVWPVEGSSELDQLFRKPLSVRQTKAKEIPCSDDLQDSELSSMKEIPVDRQRVSCTRCAGCVVSFEEVTSRNFASIQSACYNSCDMHRVLEEATQRFRIHLLHHVHMKKHHNDAAECRHTNSGRVSPATSQRNCNNLSGFTPIRLFRNVENETFNFSNRAVPALTPLRRRALPEAGHQTPSADRSSSEDQTRISTGCCSARRKRQDFSDQEIRCLLSGVKKFGFSWNFILWSYPFKPGRTNVDLAKKYRRLKKQR